VSVPVLVKGASVDTAAVWAFPEAALAGQSLVDVKVAATEIPLGAEAQFPVVAHFETAGFAEEDSA